MRTPRPRAWQAGRMRYGRHRRLRYATRGADAGAGDDNETLVRIAAG
jgi:hypothetical protein